MRLSVALVALVGGLGCVGHAAATARHAAATSERGVSTRLGGGLQGRASQPVYEGSYQGLVGKKHWTWADHGVSWEMGECRSGKLQSPVQFQDNAVDIFDNTFMYFRYDIYNRPIHLYNDGFLLMATLNDCVGGFGVGPGVVDSLSPLEPEEKYSLAGFTFHAPSEHLWNGEHLALEIQFIHRNAEDTNKQGIVSIGFQQQSFADEHPFLAALLEKDLPREERTETVVNAVSPHHLDFGKLLGDNATFHTYHGSSTVPPCRTNVKWFVKKERVMAPSTQLNAFNDAIRFVTGDTGNWRVTQETGTRKVSALFSRDASLMKTVREKITNPTGPPSVGLITMDPDHEDSVMPAPTSTDTGPDEGTKLKEAKKDGFKAKEPDSIIAAFPPEQVIEDPNGIAEADPAVKEQTVVVNDVQQNVNEADLQAGTACADVQEAADKAEMGDPSVASTLGIVYMAKKKACVSATEVANSQIRERNAEKGKLDAVKSEALEGAMAAKDRALHNEILEANMTQGGTDEKHLEPASGVKTVVAFPPPQGSMLDPFSGSCAESFARINSTFPVISEHLLPSLDQPADVPGIHTIHVDEEDRPEAPPADDADVFVQKGKKRTRPTMERLLGQVKGLRR